MPKITDYKYLVGIDFGDGETTASLIEIKPDGKHSGPDELRIVRDTSISTTKVESAIVKYPHEDFYRLSRKDYDTIFDTYEDNFKLRPDKYDLPDNDRKKTAFGKFIETVFECILKENNSEPRLEYNKLTGEKNFYLCIACPSRWWKDARNDNIDYIGKYKDLMHEHNIPVDSIIKESDAAFFHFLDEQTLPMDDSNILIIDYGSSTIDFTYHNRKGKRDLDCDGSGSTDLGAQKVEQSVLDYIIAEEPVFERSRDIISKEKLNPSICYEKYMKRRLKYAKEDFYSERENSMFEIQGNLKQLFDYKDDLFFYPKHNIMGITKGGYTAEEFERMLNETSYKENVKYEFQTIYNKETWNPDYIMITGGASKMGWVQEMVHEVFSQKGENITVIVDQKKPSYIVSHGIVKYLSAYYKFVKEFESCRQKFREKIDIDSDIAIASGKALDPYYARELCKVCDIYSDSADKSSLNDLVEMLENEEVAQLGLLLSAEEIDDINRQMISNLCIEYKRIIQDVCKDVYTKTFNISHNIDIDFPEYQFWNNIVIVGTARKDVRKQIGPYVRTCFLDSINWEKTRSKPEREEIARRMKNYYENNRLIHNITSETLTRIRVGINDRIDQWLDSIENTLPIDLYV